MRHNLHISITSHALANQTGSGRRRQDATPWWLRARRSNRVGNTALAATPPQQLGLLRSSASPIKQLVRLAMAPTYNLLLKAQPAHSPASASRPAPRQPPQGARRASDSNCHCRFAAIVSSRLAQTFLRLTLNSSVNRQPDGASLMLRRRPGIQMRCAAVPICGEVRDVLCRASLPPAAFHR